MQQIQTPKDVKKLGAILTVWAHPDDETFLAGGILAAAAYNGQTIVCVTATHGEEGIKDEKRWPASKLGEIREHELADALKILGIKKHHWLGYHDGTLKDVTDNEGSDRLKAFINQYHPDSILTFGADGWTGHPDHKAVSQWVNLAVKGTETKVFHCVVDEESYEKYMKELDKRFNIYFNIDKPPVCKENDCEIALRLPSKLCQQKCQALRAMPSQTEAMFEAVPKGYMEEALGCECYKQA